MSSKQSHVNPKYEEHRQHVLDKFDIDLNDISFFKFLLFYNEQYGFQTPGIHKEMAAWLDLTDDENMRCLQAYRHSGKSYLSGLWCCWKWLRNPDYKILLVSATKELAEDKSQFVQNLIEDFWLLQHLKPAKAKVWRADALIVDRHLNNNHYSLKCASATGKITGKHADIILADDVEVKENVETSGMRKKLWNTVRSLRSICSRQFYIGTPHAEEGESIYWKMNEWKNIYIPTLKIPVKDKNGKPANLDVMIEGAWQDEKWIKEQEEILGPAMFASQYLLSYADTTERELDHRLVKTFAGEYQQHQQTGTFGRKSVAHVVAFADKQTRELKDMVAYWDPAGGGVGHDDSVVCVMGVDDDDNTYLFDIVSLKQVTSDYDFTQQIDQMTELLIKYSVNAIHVETTGFKQILSEIKKRLATTRQAFIRVIPVTHSANQYISNEKKTRIRNYLGTALAINRFYVEASVWAKSPLRGQIIDFPAKAKDDYIDAVAGALEVIRPNRAKQGRTALVSNAVRRYQNIQLVSPVSDKIAR